LRADVVVIGSVHAPLVSVRRSAADRNIHAREQAFIFRVKISATAAPGNSVVNCTKLRPFIGSSRTCSPLMMLLTVPV